RATSVCSPLLLLRRSGARRQCALFPYTTLFRSTRRAELAPLRRLRSREQPSKLGSTGRGGPVGSVRGGVDAGYGAAGGVGGSIEAGIPCDRGGGRAGDGLAAGHRLGRGAAREALLEQRAVPVRLL